MAIPMSTPTAQSSSLAVHRCRFVNYSPAAISAIAFPPPPLPRVRESKFKRNAGGSRGKRKFGTLAIGRANGNIELCEWTGEENESQASKAWVVSKILHGPNPSKVDSLVFTLRHPHLHSYNEVPSLSDLRLFSAGGGSELVEWDLVHGTILRTLNSQGGAIWSMATNPANTLLALGCEDGCVRLLSLDADSLMHHRRFDRVKCRLLSIAWGPPTPPVQKKRKQKRTEESAVEGAEESEGSGSSSSDDDDDDEWMDSWLVTGGSDSGLRKWDVNTGRALDKMTTDKTRGERTLVWAVGVLADGTIISGDSLGIVKFWDSRTCTQLYSFQAHGADVLCLDIGPDGNSVFTSGVDQKVCLFTHVKFSNQDKAKKSLRPNSRWVHSTAKRMHSHDVRALAVWPPYLPIAPSSLKSFSPSTSTSNPFADIAPVLASGGPDGSLVLAPCASALAAAQPIVNPLMTSALCTFEDAYHRRMPYTTGLAPAVTVSRGARLIVCARVTSVSVWRILGRARIASPLELDLRIAAALEEDIAGAGGASAPTNCEKEEECGYEKALDMDLDTTTNICVSAVSDDGRWLAVADVYETKLFELLNVDGALRPRRVKTFMALLKPYLPKTSPSEGASALGFAPDSSRLVLASALSAYVFIVDLTGREEDGRPAPRVLRKFEHHRRKGEMFGLKGRLMKGMPGRADRTPVNGRKTAVDVEMDNERKIDYEEDVPSSDAEEVEGEKMDRALVTRMSFSPDGQWLATTDDRCRTQIFNLDAVQHHTTLPTSPSPVAAFAFSPSAPVPTAALTIPAVASQTPVLLMAHADASLTVYDVEARHFPKWAAHLAQRERLPKRWTGLHDGVLGVVFEAPEPPAPVNLPAHNQSSDISSTPAAPAPPPLANPITGRKKPKKPKQLAPVATTSTGIRLNGQVHGEKEKADTAPGQRHALFWGATWLCRVTLDAPVGWGGFLKKRRREPDSQPYTQAGAKTVDPRDSQQQQGEHGQGQGQHRQDEEEITNFKLVTRYRPLLCVDLLAPGELLVVERPLLDVLRGLPPAFFKPKYGS